MDDPEFGPEQVRAITQSFPETKACLFGDL